MMNIKYILLYYIINNYIKINSYSFDSRIVENYSCNKGELLLKTSKNNLIKFKNSKREILDIINFKSEKFFKNDYNHNIFVISSLSKLYLIKECFNFYEEIKFKDNLLDILFYNENNFIGVFGNNCDNIDICRNKNIDIYFFENDNWKLLYNNIQNYSIFEKNKIIILKNNTVVIYDFFKNKTNNFDNFEDFLVIKNFVILKKLNKFYIVINNIVNEIKIDIKISNINFLTSKNNIFLVNKIDDNKFDIFFSFLNQQFFKKFVNNIGINNEEYLIREIKSLNGVFIANFYDKKYKIFKTKITFDNMKNWDYIQNYEIVNKKQDCHYECYLHLNLNYNFNQNIIYHKKLPGLIISHGNLGNFLNPKFNYSSVFISFNSGYNWKEIFEEPKLISISNNGDIIIFIEKNKPTKEIYYTNSNKINLIKINIYEKALKFNSIINLENNSFLINGLDKNKEIIIILDLNLIFKKICSKNDYIESEYNLPCVNGIKFNYFFKKENKICQNSLENYYLKKYNCKCELDDFICSNYSFQDINWKCIYKKEFEYLKNKENLEKIYDDKKYLIFDNNNCINNYDNYKFKINNIFYLFIIFFIIFLMILINKKKFISKNKNSILELKNINNHINNI